MKWRVVPLVTGLSLAVLGIVLVATWLSVRQPFSGLFWIEGTGVVSGVYPGGPAAAAGLRAGDVVLEIGGVPTTSVRRATALSARVGDLVPVTFRRGGATRSAGIAMVVPSTLARLHRLEAPLIALCFALFGFAVWAHKPYDRTVVLFVLFSYSIALLLGLGSLRRLQVPFAFLGFVALLALTPAVGVHFHLLFPRPRAFRHRLTPALYVLALLAPALYLPGLRQDEDRGWYSLSLSAATACVVAGVAALAALLVQAYRTTSSEAERRRVRLVVFGTVLGSAPGVVLSLLPEVLTTHERRYFVRWEVTLPFLLLIPISYVLAIQRHDLLRIERVASRGVVHLVVFSTVVALYAALAVGLPWLAPWADGPLARGFVVLLVALLFAPMRRWLQTGADRFFYGGWYDYRSVLGDMTRELAAIVDADTLADLLGRRLPGILRVEGASLLLPGGEAGLERASGTGWPTEARPAALDRSGPLGLALVHASGPLTTAELAAAAEGPSDEDQAWLRRPEIELWVPLVLRDSLQGILLLGPKLGGEPFDAEDRRLLGTLAWSAAVAVENVRLFSALRRRADDVNRLYSQLLQSREEERKRLARELHDRVIQDLVNLNYFLETGPADAASKATVDAARQRLRGVVDSLRQVSTQLRPAALDDLSLGLAVQGYLEEARGKYGLRIALRIPPRAQDRLEALPEEVRVSLFRVLQEAVQNVHRHARATRVEVDLALEGDGVLLEVRDDGRGFLCPAELGGLVRQRHFGLAGAQERMALVGGRLEVVSGVGVGTTLRATAPLALEA